MCVCVCVCGSMFGAHYLHGGELTTVQLTSSILSVSRLRRARIRRRSRANLGARGGQRGKCGQDWEGAFPTFLSTHVLGAGQSQLKVVTVQMYMVSACERECK